MAPGIIAEWSLGVQKPVGNSREPPVSASFLVEPVSLITYKGAFSPSKAAPLHALRQRAQDMEGSRFGMLKRGLVYFVQRCAKQIAILVGGSRELFLGI